MGSFSTFAISSAVLVVLLVCYGAPNVNAYGTNEWCDPQYGFQLATNSCCAGNPWYLIPYSGWCCMTQVDGQLDCLCKKDYISDIQILKPTCQLANAAVNGGWSAWGAYETCSATCGTNGSQKRTRTCTNPAPANGGAYCVGAQSESRSCPNATCPVPVVDGGWSSWGLFSTCTATCGSIGTQTRFRYCTNPAPQNGGAYCVGAQSETISCPNTTCPPTAINGGWSDWGAWSACSVTCGSGGYQVRTRSCSNPYPANCGAQCSGVNYEIQSCSASFGCAVNGSWSEWSAYGLCSATCGSDGVQTRTRSCTNPAPQNGGLQCVGESTESALCPNTTCPVVVNGNWADWSDWSTCPVTCGNSGVQFRTRTCTNPLPQNGGLYCAGSPFESQSCPGTPLCPLCPAGTGARRKRSVTNRLLNGGTLDACRGDGIIGIEVLANGFRIAACNGVVGYDPLSPANFVIYTDPTCVELLNQTRNDPSLTDIANLYGKEFNSLSTVLDIDNAEVTGGIATLRPTVFGNYTFHSAKEGCETVACLYNAATMASSVDKSNCYIASFGTLTLTEISSPGGNIVNIASGGSCTDAPAGSECFTAVDPSQSSCTSDTGAPVYCALATGEEALYGILAFSAVCSSNNPTFNVLPLNV